MIKIEKGKLRKKIRSVLCNIGIHLGKRNTFVFQCSHCSYHIPVPNQDYDR